MVETFANLFFLGVGAIVALFGVRWLVNQRNLSNKVKILEISLERKEIKDTVDHADIDLLIKQDNARGTGGSGNRSGSGET